MSRGDYFRALAREADARWDRLEASHRLVREGVDTLGRFLKAVRRTRSIDWLTFAKSGKSSFFDPVFLALLSEGNILREELNSDVITGLSQLVGVPEETVRWTLDFVHSTEKKPGALGRISGLLGEKMGLLVPSYMFAQSAPRYAKALGPGAVDQTLELEEAGLALSYSQHPVLGLTVDLSASAGSRLPGRCTVSVISGDRVKTGPEPLEEGQARFPGASLDPGDSLAIEAGY